MAENINESDYFSEYIKDSETSLSDSLISLINTTEGIYQVIPEQAKIYTTDYKYSLEGKIQTNPSKNLLELYNILINKEVGTLLLHDPANTNATEVQYDFSGLASLNFSEDTFAYITTDKINTHNISQILTSVGSWKLWGFLLDSEFEKDAILLDNLDFLRNHLKVAFIEIFDGEGFLVWLSHSDPK